MSGYAGYLESLATSSDQNESPFLYEKTTWKVFWLFDYVEETFLFSLVFVGLADIQFWGIIQSIECLS